MGRNYVLFRKSAMGTLLISVVSTPAHPLT